MKDIDWSTRQPRKKGTLPSCLFLEVISNELNILLLLSFLKKLVRRGILSYCTRKLSENLYNGFIFSFG